MLTPAKMMRHVKGFLLALLVLGIFLGPYAWSVWHDRNDDDGSCWAEDPAYCDHPLGP